MFSGLFSETDKNAVLPSIKTTGTEGSSHLYNSKGEADFVRTTGGKRRKRRGGTNKKSRRRRSRHTRSRK
jgi:hypothetical protein